MSPTKEIANALRPNEIVRLRCFKHCPLANQCDGLETRSLEALKLLERQNANWAPSEFGRRASSEASSQSRDVPPLLAFG